MGKSRTIYIREIDAMTSDQWFAVVMLAVSAFLGWCVTMAVYDVTVWGAV